MKLFIYTPDKGNTFLLNCCRSSIVCLDGCFVIIIVVVGGTPAEFHLAQKGGGGEATLLLLDLVSFFSFQLIMNDGVSRASHAPSIPQLLFT